MTDPPPSGESNVEAGRDHGGERGRPSPDRTPRWVIWFGIIAILVAVLFAIVHLMGRGLGGHAG